jgi:hypothetical protein
LLDAIDRAPVEFIAAISTIIRSERDEVRQPGNEQMTTFFSVLDNLSGCWRNDALRDAILAELRNPENTPSEYAVLLERITVEDEDKVIGILLKGMCV